MSVDDSSDPNVARAPEAENFPHELLEGLEGAQRQGRIDVINDLLADGVSVEQIRNSATDQRLLLIGLTRLLRGTPDLNNSQVLLQTGIDPELFTSTLEAAGIRVPDEDALVWEERDLAYPRLIKQLSELGIGDDVLIKLATLVGDLTSRTSLGLSTTIGNALNEPGDTEYELGERLKSIVEPLNQNLGDALRFLVRENVLKLLDTVNLDATQVADGRLANTVWITIAFVDVVEYTKLGEDIGPEALTDIAAKLRQIATDVVTGTRVRVVKGIGDAVMLSGWSPSEVARTMLEIQQKVLDEDYPAVRIGIASGDATPRDGDWFGPPVNWAARICASAHPGTVLADDNTRSQSEEEDLAWSSIGKVRLKGIGRVPLYRLRVPRKSKREHGDERPESAETDEELPPVEGSDTPEDS